jgi:hypothetical protein
MAESSINPAMRLAVVPEAFGNAIETIRCLFRSHITYRRNNKSEHTVTTPDNHVFSQLAQELIQLFTSRGIVMD